MGQKKIQCFILNEIPMYHVRNPTKVNDIESKYLNVIEWDKQWIQCHIEWSLMTEINVVEWVINEIIFLCKGIPMNFMLSNWLSMKSMLSFMGFQWSQWHIVWNISK